MFCLKSRSRFEKMNLNDAISGEKFYNAWLGNLKTESDIVAILLGQTENAISKIHTIIQFILD